MELEWLTATLVAKIILSAIALLLAARLALRVFGRMAGSGKAKVKKVAEPSKPAPIQNEKVAAGAPKKWDWHTVLAPITWLVAIGTAAWVLWWFFTSTEVGKIITGSGTGRPFCSSAALSGNAKGCYRTPRSSSSAKLTTQKSVAEIESERGSFCFNGKKTPPWVQIPEGGYDLKYSTVPASAEPVTQCAYSPAKPGQNASGSKYSCDGAKNAYWFRAKAAKPDSGEVCVRYRFVLRT